jgi:ferredoxin-NADP reductase/DMSO/TMAO reductase YedYZ heme-binding membrane subunit
MQTTDASLRPRAVHVDTAFAKLLVFINAGVPLLMLGWDAYRHQLGVNGVNFAIHTTGLLGLLFLLFSLTITPVRRLTGWNWLIAVRRTLGLYAFFYLCVHFGIFFILDRAASVTSTVHELLTRRYLQIGACGLALLVPLALTSTNAMVTRLGARRWKALHRISYLATALGALHYYLLVKADVRQPLAFAAALGGLLAFRAVWLGLDRRTGRAKRAGAHRERRFWSGELRVLRIIEETRDVRTFRLGVEGATRLPFVHQPGQYLNVALTIDGERVNRSYTIASSPTQSSYCEITVKRQAAGRASRYLHDVLREGAMLKISAPVGRFIFTGADSDGVLLIAGGVGITPIMAILRYLTDNAWAGQMYLVFVVRERRDIIFSDELGRLERRFPNLHVFVTLSGEEDDSWVGHRGRITREFIRTVVPDAIRRPIFLCGPGAMMTETRALLAQLGVPHAQIRTEAFVSTVTASAGASGNPAKAEPETQAAPSAEVAGPAGDGVPTVYFRRSMKSADLPPPGTVLEAAEDAGLSIPFECRSGICGQCKTKLLVGRVTMEVQDALSAADRSKGIILACQARPVGDVSVDA